MSAFFVYPMVVLLVLVTLISLFPFAIGTSFRKTMVFLAGSSPLWVGFLGGEIAEALVGSYSGFAEDWGWAWGLSHMFFGAPTVFTSFLAIQAMKSASAKKS